MIMVFRKSTVRPLPSVSRPSSRTWSHIWWNSLAASVEISIFAPLAVGKTLAFDLIDQD